MKCYYCKIEAERTDLVAVVYKDTGRIYVHPHCKTPLANVRWEEKRKTPAGLTARGGHIAR